MTVSDLSCRLGGYPILHDISFDIPPGTRTAIVGANGAGKSTLLRAIAGLQSLTAGSVRITAAHHERDSIPVGRSIHKISTRRRAQLMAVVGQEETPSAEMTVGEVVALGRTPHRTPWSAGGAEERRIIAESLAKVGLSGLEHVGTDALSGGQRHRVMLARGLAQQACLLMLDEPTNHLDAAWRLRFMDILDGLPCTVVAAMHELDLVLRHFDQVVVLDAGHVRAAGHPADVLRSSLVRDVFGIHSTQVPHPETQRPHLLITDFVRERTRS
ncbi:ABC transporter ATP-binding protein [Rhodococcus aetherivorans]|uniref:ABC transporter ATP-binding protein n=1 Tax=Rhodococcus aetherivorans TaxID=191292 RepID=UPI00294A21E2|nr:ABC transporter ATP-binding protein [Rhodococcus aetherivorans]MDV6296698.1 ABC transporter ATP-binding protein [Rhodococcus aetherivorans]